MREEEGYGWAGVDSNRNRDSRSGSMGECPTVEAARIVASGNLKARRLTIRRYESAHDLVHSYGGACGDGFGLQLDSRLCYPNLQRGVSAAASFQRSQP